MEARGLRVILFPNGHVYCFPLALPCTLLCYCDSSGAAISIVHVVEQRAIDFGLPLSP